MLALAFSHLLPIQSGPKSRRLSSPRATRVRCSAEGKVCVAPANTPDRPSRASVAVPIALIRPPLLHPNIARLAVGEHRQLGAEILQLQSCHLFVQALGQQMHT